MTPCHVTRVLPPAGRCVRVVAYTMLLLLLGWASTDAVARDASRDQMKGLDEQVQEIKSDVLSIAAELDGLEERLLYPSNTQVAVFVELDEGDEFRLDSVQIQLNGNLVAHHIYSFKELEALQGGGVQRVYTGNIPTGSHQIDVSVIGKLPSGKEVAESASFGFDKDVEPALVGVTLAGVSSGSNGIRVGEW